MRIQWNEKKFVVVSVLLLFALFGISLLQNIIRYRNHSSYSIWTSIIYLLISLLLFVPVIVLTVRLQKYLKKKVAKWYWPFTVFNVFAILGLFYLVSNVILHSFGFFDHYVDTQYARYYFGREALYHLLLILGASVFVQISASKKRTILVSKGRKNITIGLDKVLWIEVEGHYLNFYTATGTYIKRERLGMLAQQLEPDFIRIHRKYVVNKSQIQSMEKDKRDEFVVLNSGKRLKIGQSFKPISW